MKCVSRPSREEKWKDIPPRDDINSSACARLSMLLWTLVSEKLQVGSKSAWHTHAEAKSYSSVKVIEAYSELVAAALAEVKG